MLKHHETKILPYTDQQLFDLVSDVGSYPQFLPWCQGVRITQKSETHMMADLIVGYKMYEERFTSKVLMEHPKAIEVDYQNGPMKHLINRWQFKATEQGYCEIDFYVEFEFKSKLFQGVASVFFNEGVKKMVQSFEKRAAELYG